LATPMDPGNGAPSCVFEIPGKGMKCTVTWWAG
jgi:hypothetical protein